MTLEDQIDCVARSDAKVLITGENALENEHVAQQIHQRGHRRQAALVIAPCASLTESELIGRADKPGLLRLADGGTLFLDNVAEMSPRVQGLLLRFLETGKIPTGGLGQATVNIRIITAADRDLARAVASCEFREDLFYRLSVIQIQVQPSDLMA
jgi:transcriptional regulator with GAF, ATPase, and Fis domain